MAITIATLAEKVVVTLMAKPISDGVVNILKNSPEEKVAKALEKALDKVSPDNEFWKNDVKRQVGEVIQILIYTLDNPQYLNNNPLPNYIDEKTIESFKECLKNNPEAWDYIQKVHYEEILKDIRIDVRMTKDIVKDNNQKLIYNSEALKRIEEKLDGVNINPIQQTKHIKIFLASSITELEDERLKLADYVNNVVAPILNNAGFYVRLYKCEDNPSGNFSGSSQEVINNELSNSDISVFLFKKKAGKKTIQEFDLARGLQSQEGNKHEIYVYCFDVPESEKSKELITFQQRLENEEFYWKTCKDIDSLERQFLPGLLKQLFGEKIVSEVNRNSNIETDGDARFKLFEDNEEQQALLREKLHQDIGGLLEQINDIIKDESINIAVRITKVLDLYQKADRWANATAYDKNKYSDLLFDYASFLQEYGLYQDAESVYLRQIDLAKELYGKEHENTATSYNNIGKVYDEQSAYDKALEYHFKALAIWEKVFGTENPNTATSYNNIGLVFYNQGEFVKALEYYQKALKIDEKVLGIEHPATAIEYNNIGLVYDKQSAYDKALEYYFKALAIWKKVLGTEHSDFATSYNNIGLVYNNQGEFSKALEYFFKAVVIWEKVLGTEHPNIAFSYNNIGLVYYNQGEFNKALEYHFKALAIWENALGTEHPNTALSYNNIGLVYYNQGEFSKALDYFFKALAIWEKVLGIEHPNTALSYNNIGMVYYNQGEFSKALEYHFKALAIWKKVSSTEHPNAALSYNNIGLVYYDQGDFDKALEYFFKALALWEKVLGTKHPNTALSYNNIGLMYREKGDYKTALDYYTKAYQIYKEKFGENHPNTKDVLESIDNVKNMAQTTNPIIGFFRRLFGI